MTTATSSTIVPVGTWTIDPSHSEVGFVARHAMIAKVRGTFNNVTGTVTVAGNFADSTASATIAADSVNTGSADRDAHLRSGDFFDVEQFPSIEFASTGIRNIDGTDFVLDGNLTIKGTSVPVSLAVEYNGAETDPFGNNRIGFSASTEVEREQFGLTWNAVLESGGVLVGKKVKLELELSLIQA